MFDATRPLLLVDRRTVVASQIGLARDKDGEDLPLLFGIPSSNVRFEELAMNRKSRVSNWF